MKIVLLEDDYLQSDLIISEIQASLKNVRITLIDTEFSFLSSFSDFEKDLPDVFLLDIMIRWADTSPNIPPAPQEVKEEGFFTAGFRCQRTLTQNSKLKDIPIIFYSVLDKIDLEDKLKNMPKTVSHVSKEKDISYLVDHMKRILHNKLT